MTAGLSHKDKKTVNTSVLKVENKNAFEPIFRALRILTPPLSTTIVITICQYEKDESLLQLVNKCFKDDSFSFSPLIFHYISNDSSKDLAPIFQNINGSDREEQFAHEYYEIARSLIENERDKNLILRLLHLGVKVHIGGEDADLI